MDLTIARSDESIHSVVAQEFAFFNHQWWRPTFFYSLYLNKPPLQLWGTAILLKIFGDYNFVYRIIPAFAGLGSLCLLLYISRLLFTSLMPGVFAIGILLGGHQILFDHGMRVGTQDASLLFFSTLSLVAFYSQVKRPQTLGSLGWWLVAFGIAGGTMTKWVGGLFPVLVMGGFWGARFFWNTHRWREFFWVATAVFVGVIPVTVFLAIHFLHDYDATMASLTFNIGDRLFGAGHHNQERLFFYWNELFVRGAFGSPSLLIIGVLVGGVIMRTAHRLESLFLITWFLAGFITYSILNSRLPWYVLPAVPAIAIFAGAAFHQLMQRGKAMQWGVIVLLSIFALPAINKAVTKVGSREKEKIDIAVDDLRTTMTPIYFDEVNPNLERSADFSRRQLLYLRRLVPLAVTDITHARAVVLPKRKVPNEEVNAQCFPNEGTFKRVIGCILRLSTGNK